MIGHVIVMEAGQYEAWLASTAGVDEPPSVSGRRLSVAYGCTSCHDARAPTLAGLFASSVTLADGSCVLADENYIHQSIVDPSSKLVSGYAAIMPSYRGQLSEEQILELVAYIKSLS